METKITPPATLTPEEIAHYDSLPPIALEKWMEEIGKAPCTVLEWRKKGFLRVENICGKLYVTRAETALFNRRLKNGEFGKEIKCAHLVSSRNRPRLRKPLRHANRPASCP